jgi:hypothetical protein
MGFQTNLVGMVCSAKVAKAHHPSLRNHDLDQRARCHHHCPFVGTGTMTATGRTSWMGMSPLLHLRKDDDDDGQLAD